jgi:hypothetical protein
MTLFPGAGQLSMQSTGARPRRQHRSSSFPANRGSGTASAQLPLHAAAVSAVGVACVWQLGDRLVAPCSSCLEHRALCLRWARPRRIPVVRLPSSHGTTGFCIDCTAATNRTRSVVESSQSATTSCWKSGAYARPPPPRQGFLPLPHLPA